MEKKTESIKVVTLDSSIFVDHLRGHPPATLFFHSLISKGKEDVLFSAITETELIAGQSCENNDIKNKVLQMLNSFHKREVTNRVALVAGDLCRRYGVDLPDGIIAATAIINKSELFTKNLKDFQKIEGLKVVAPY